LIIENADRFGLSQLHQLRGRVGRSTRHAYAYFTYRPDKALSEVAEKRLSAIRDFAEFGSGFKIAMRDLEIRGAGNLLGAEQSGHMMSVGYDMYLKLLDEAVLEQRGEKPKMPECTADLNITANVDKNYVSRGEERMDLYRRMAAIRSQADADDLLDVLFPEPVLIAVLLIAVAGVDEEDSLAGLRIFLVNEHQAGGDARPVEQEKLDAILEAARLAPSACNGQPYHFTVCRGQAAKDVAAATMGMGMNKFASQSPVMIVVSEEPYNKSAALGSTMVTKGRESAKRLRKYASIPPAMEPTPA